MQSEARPRSSSPPPPSATPRSLGWRPPVSLGAGSGCASWPQAPWGQGRGHGEERTALRAFVVFSKCVLYGQRGAKCLHVPSILTGTEFGSAVPPAPGTKEKFPQRKGAWRSVLSRPNINAHCVFSKTQRGSVFAEAKELVSAGLVSARAGVGPCWRNYMPQPAGLKRQTLGDPQLCHSEP